MSEFYNQKIMITGCAGLLGTALIDNISTNHNVLGIYLNTEPQIVTSAKIRYKKADLTKAEAVAGLIEEYQPDTIVNSAGWVDVDGCESDLTRAENSNFGIAKNIVDVIKETDIYLIQISTDYIFNGRAHPGKIDDKPDPLNFYGQTKLMAEDYIKENLENYLIARTCALLGNPNQGRTNLINYFYDRLSHGRKVTAPNDLYANPIWINNLSELIAEAVQKNIRGAVHLGGADYLSRYEFARIFAEIFGFKADLVEPVSAVSQERPAKRPQYAGLDISDTVPKFATKFLTVREALTRIREHST